LSRCSLESTPEPSAAEKCAYDEYVIGSFYDAVCVARKELAAATAGGCSNPLCIAELQEEVARLEGNLLEFGYNPNRRMALLAKASLP
jgi:hypothetical protein